MDSDALAVHSICHSAMSWNAVSEVLDIESTFETRSEKATKGGDQRSKTRHKQQVDLIGHKRDRVDLTWKLHE